MDEKHAKKYLATGTSTVQSFKKDTRKLVGIQNYEYADTNNTFCGAFAMSLSCTLPYT